MESSQTDTIEDTDAKITVYSVVSCYSTTINLSIPLGVGLFDQTTQVTTTRLDSVPTQINQSSISTPQQHSTVFM